MMKKFILIIIISIISILNFVKADDPPYIPCKSLISFSYDDSKQLSTNDFRTHISFISNAIGGLNYPNRLRGEGGYGGEFDWNSGLSIAQMESALGYVQQSDMPYSLAHQFAGLSTSLDVLDNFDLPKAALIFISDTSVDALRNADRYLSKLKNVRITFVLLGANAESHNLRNFSNNFIYWQDLSESQPDNWDMLSFAAYGCSGSSLTTTIPTNLPTFASTPSQNNSSCKSWINFSFDDSIILISQNFNTQINFILSVIGALNYTNQIQAIGVYSDSVLWNSGFTLQKIISTLGNVSQYGGYSLRYQLAGIAESLERMNNISQPIAAIVFVSGTASNLISGAQIYIDYLKNVRLTFVLLGPDVDQTRLTNYTSNFIYWPDLSKPQPDNWDSLSSAALGCSSDTTPTPTPPSQCIDTSSDCNQTMNDCKNALYKPLLCKYCQKSCNLCSDPACTSSK